MIRVCILALLSLGALVLIARSLPPAPAVSAPAAEESAPDEAWMGIWDGVWEGELRTYGADGAMDESTRVRREHATISATEQDVVITEYPAGLPERRWRGRIVARSDGRLERRVWGSDGSVRAMAGVREGRALRWYGVDPQESSREEVLQALSGDLYTIDGASLPGAEHPGMVLFTGRYRRAPGSNP